MTTLVELPHFSLVYDSTHACLYATWQGQHDGPSTQANYELIFKYVCITRSTKLLNDGLLDQNGWKEVTNWLANECFQLLAQEGLAIVAWVLPRNLEAYHDTHKLLLLLERPFVGTFADPEAAYEWLHQWPKPAKHEGGWSYN